MRHFLLAVIAASLPATAAMHESDADYFPLAAGDERIWEITNTGDDRTVHIYHEIVEKPVEKNGKTYWPIRGWDGRGSVNSLRFYRKDATGVFSFVDGQVPDQQIILFPLKAGAMWDVGEWSFRKEAGFENVVIGSVTYRHCLHLIIFPGHYGTSRWFAPGIGEVKRTSSSPFGHHILTLREFKPAK